ncbi:caa(3)-type oxidase subunit IV [Sinobacterium caligoides]|uniref:Caa(3)-type oxidase subunit IV n=1 Tax=Sinobacterium caligoides TaxID=933926 RepID=A0A3N2DNS9_9GAMM|nr:cytochrome C oxidase subunit IV family protein [Sinobacterium caligoides]ROS00975.1 caa(3)-type oxidase subunit IV [Sinobacterium caligoides]
MSSQPERVAKQHSIGLYLKVWVLLFFLSTLSYLVDYYHLQGGLRWTLILFFMLLKAGLIVIVFMHVKWERLAVKVMLILPLLAIVIFIGMMAIEADYTFVNRLLFLASP